MLPLDHYDLRTWQLLIRLPMSLKNHYPPIPFNYCVTLITRVCREGTTLEETNIFRPANLPFVPRHHILNKKVDVRA